MPRYIFELKELSRHKIEAESKEDAIKKVENGDIGEFVEYIGWDFTRHSVKKLGD